MDRLLDSFRTVFGNGFLKYFKEQDKKHKYLKLDDYQKVIQRFIEDEQFFRTNYYSGTHVHFTRFLFVSIENFKNNDRTINFTELDHKGKLIWQLEHIIPQSKFEPGDSDKNKLGNLTLLHGDTNVKISNENFEEKKKALHDENELKFYINEVFRRNNFKKSDIDKRSSDLTNDLVDIINNHFDAYCEKVLKIKNMELNNE
ncbi:HNH endonuclease family protein [Streptococcus infantis]|uniref:HNH endonuclease family protein n=1 Tax=Streptococcus infantis TaxID=68892 RepID=UPI0039C2ECCC